MIFTCDSCGISSPIEDRFAFIGHRYSFLACKKCRSEVHKAQEEDKLSICKDDFDIKYEKIINRYFRKNV